MQHLLFLHGALGSADQLQPLSLALSGKYIIHTLNFSGHGGENDSVKYTIPAFAEEVLHYLDKKKISHSPIFGYSMGGYIALYLARHHPEKISRIFTMSTKFLWTPEIALRETKMLNPEKITEKIPAFAQALERRHHPNDWKKLMLKTADLMTELGDRPALTDEDLEQLTLPVLVGIGDADTMVSLEETIHAYRKLKNGNLIVFPKTSHPIEKMDIKKLAREIEWFMKESS